MKMIQANLVMESRGFAPQVRSGFSDIWSKLYQAETYVLDISCHSGGESNQLQGQVMNGNDSAPYGRVTLYNEQQKFVADLDQYGQFQLNVNKPGNFKLQVDLSEASFAVNDLDIS